MASLIVALDLPNAPKAIAMAGRLKGIAPWVKVGLELFIASGPEILARLKNLGFRVFLDLKLYDIPNTVACAVRAAAAAGCDMLTLHLQGGARMCEAARIAAGKNPLLLGVTALTSFGAGEMPGIALPPSEFAWKLAGLAAEWGLAGVVCSGFEVARIKSAFPGLLCVCPGIRPRKIADDDQRRALTPGEAVTAGADFIVVGRPILQAADPGLAAEEIIAAMCLAKNSVQTRIQENDASASAGFMKKTQVENG